MSKRLQALLALLATVLMVSGSGLVISSASATGGSRPIEAKALTSHGCDSSEWHFVITQVDSAQNAPAAITVTWANGDSESVPLDKVTGGVAHYATTSNLDSTVTSATTDIYTTWSGQFNLSHGPCGGDEPPPPSEPEGSNNSSSPSCEKITVGTPTDVKPEGATVVVKLDGEVTQPGTYDVTPGTHVVTTYVNGVEVDKDTVTVEACPAPPAEPEGAVLAVSNDCETITFSSKDVKPEDADVVLKLDGVVKSAGTYDVAPGSHTVELWVNGKKVDSKTVTVKKCEVTPPPEECPVLTGSVKTTLADGSVVNGNIYDSKSDVYVSGSQLGDITTVYIRVTDPSGSTVLSDVKQVTVSDGSFGPVQLPSFADTPNNGGEYKVWVSSTSDFEQSCTKTDNFKVKADQPPPPTSVTPAKPSATQPNCEQPNMTVTPGSQPGVVWTPSGETVLEPGESVTYTVTPAEGYEFPEDAQTEWTFTNTFDTETCEQEPTPVIPTEPTPTDVCEPPTGPTNDRIAIPADANFTYQVDGKDEKAGSFVATGTSHTVEAVAKEGVVIKEGAKTEWMFTFTKVACVTTTETPSPTPTPTPTETPTVTPTPTPTGTPTSTPTSTSVPTPTATPTFVPPSAGGGDWPPSDVGTSDYSLASLAGKLFVLGGFAIFLLLGYERWGRRRSVDMA